MRKDGLRPDQDSNLTINRLLILYIPSFPLDYSHFFSYATAQSMKLSCYLSRTQSLECA